MWVRTPCALGAAVTLKGTVRHGFVGRGLGIVLGSSFWVLPFVQGTANDHQGAWGRLLSGRKWVHGFAKVGVGMGRYWPVTVGLYLVLS